MMLSMCYFYVYGGVLAFHGRVFPYANIQFCFFQEKHHFEIHFLYLPCTWKISLKMQKLVPFFSP